MESNHLKLPLHADLTFPVAHTWLRPLAVSFNPGTVVLQMEEILQNLKQEFVSLGHKVLEQATGAVDILITTAALHQPIHWREAYMFNARRNFHLEYHPTVFTLVQIMRKEYESLLVHFEKALQKEEPDPQDYAFPGLAENARFVMHEQGRRAGPILSIMRLLQGQTKCIRIILVVGDTHPEEAFTFDLVGAYPRTQAVDPAFFYRDLTLRMVTAACTHGITAHQVLGEEISARAWETSSTPGSMKRAGREFGQRTFFTRMQRVGDLVDVPLFNEVVSRQYSEGCFATWDAGLDGLVTTITGSARPVDKDQLSDDEMAVIVGVQPDGSGALVRRVEGNRNDPPSSEAVELIGMDMHLPRILLDKIWNIDAEVPVTRSKLHGHRGVRAYDPAQVEFVLLDPPFYSYPVSCSTQAQAQAIMTGFGRSQALSDPNDPRQLAFTILPGHGMVVVEKWVQGKQPFQLMWEAMDSGALQIDKLVSQGPLEFVAGEDGLMHLHE